jgi:hypothetical protein
MVSRIELIPSEVRGYGDIVSPKTLDDFELWNSTLELTDGVYTLMYNSLSITLTAEQVDITYGESAVLTATVLNGDAPVIGETVTLYESGNVVETSETDSDGEATFTVAGLSIGSYEFNAIVGIVESNTVTVTVNAPIITYDGVELSSDKSILSYYNNESATLSAQLMDGTDLAYVEGVTIEFFKGSTSMGTSQTNSQGLATKTYASSGVGDVSFTASVGTISSETYSIEDCDYYADSTKISTWGNVSSGGTAFKKSTYAIGLDSYSVEMKFNSINAQLMVGNEANWVGGLSFASSPYYLYTHTSNGGTNTDTISSPVASDIWRMEVEGTTIRLYRNDNLHITKTNRKVDYPKNLRLYPSTNSNSVDYVKVKPL